VTGNPARPIRVRLNIMVATHREFIPALAALAVAAAALAGCEKKQPPIDGIGPWHIGRSVKSEGTICRPLERGITYCSHNPEMNIAEHRATVDLYFRGTDDSAPLSEILLALGACDVQAVDRWLTSKLGVAPEHRGRAPVWPGAAATVVALLPAQDGVCEIHFLEPGDHQRLAQLAKESQPAPARP
jgi:hypothetical protein